jgi:hypothetical protein
VGISALEVELHGSRVAQPRAWARAPGRHRPTGPGTGPDGPRDCVPRGRPRGTRASDWWSGTRRGQRCVPRPVRGVQGAVPRAAPRPGLIRTRYALRTRLRARPTARPLTYCMRACVPACVRRLRCGDASRPCAHRPRSAMSRRTRSWRGRWARVAASAGGHGVRRGVQAAVETSWDRVHRVTRQLAESALCARVHARCG